MTVIRGDFKYATLLAVVICSSLVVLVAGSSSQCDKASAGKDDPPFPGFHQMGFGYDLTNGQSKNAQVLNLKNQKSCAWYNQQTNRYEAVPRSITLQPGLTFSGTSTYVYMATQQQFMIASSDSKSNGFKSGNDVSLTVSVPETPVKASTTIPPLLNAHSSSVTGHSSSLYKSSERSYGYSFEKRTTLRATITNTTSLLSNTIVSYIKSNLPKAYDKSKYIKFFQQYGTHWIKDYQFGGLAMMEVEYMKYVENYQSLDARQKESNLAFSFFFSHMSKKNSMASQNSYKGAYTTSTSFYVTGGTPGSNWINSLYTTPSILDRGLAEYSILVQHDKRIPNAAAIAANLKQGLQDYTDMQRALYKAPPTGPTDDRLPLVVYLYADPKNAGARRVVVDNMPHASAMHFDDTVSSIEILPGPGYKAYQNKNKKEPAVNFYADPNYTGTKLVKLIGKVTFEELRGTGMEDRISSLSFSAAPYSEMPALLVNPYGPNYYKPVPAVVYLYADPNNSGNYVVAIEDVPNFNNYYHFLNDGTSAIKVRVGNWPSGKHPPKVIVYADPNYTGTSYSLTSSTSVCNWSASNTECNISISLLNQHHLNDRITAIKVE